MKRLFKTGLDKILVKTEEVVCGMQSKNHTASFVDLL
jgi:hypothetical protein